MNVEVADEFVEVLKNVERDVPPGNVVDWLEWASKNPEEAKRLAETYGRLSWCGRHKFAVCLWCGESPDYAIKSAVEEDEKHRSKRSILSKAIINAKKGGYRFTMPNGVECTVVRDRGEGPIGSASK
ncbi:MAG: hypothetical protein N0A00_01580 [Candidatus Bathyarchaeota archaeon]|nr:hypothetical protein [Candidatus Bathyarchaeota archaeon]